MPAIFELYTITSFDVKVTSDSKFFSAIKVFSFVFSALSSEQSKLCSEHNDSISLESGLLSWKSIQEPSEITDDLIEICWSSDESLGLRKTVGDTISPVSTKSS
ncbi:unnamed protein product [Brugia timori]|uniref:Uncharacterized protein n=1 Tax=Brugia timori TaxID=42155 RepID=A0A3P7U3P9_9BILA|nr:unnamed protein product [Brugia timori]